MSHAQPLPPVAAVIEDIEREYARNVACRDPLAAAVRAMGYGGLTCRLRSEAVAKAGDRARMRRALDVAADTVDADYAADVARATAEAEARIEAERAHYAGVDWLAAAE